MAEKEPAEVPLEAVVWRKGHRESPNLSLTAAPGDVKKLTRYLENWLRGRNVVPERRGEYELVVRRPREYKVLHRVRAEVPDGKD